MSEFDSFFSHYAERYMASDVDAISAAYEAPLLAVREGRAIHLSDRAAVRGHLTELMAAYQNAGAARADIAEIDVMSLGKSSAMVTVRWRVLDGTDALVRDFRTTYHVLRRDGTGTSFRTRTTIDVPSSNEASYAKGTSSISVSEGAILGP